MAAKALDQVGAAGHDPRLRPAEQLVAREADEVGAGGEARGGRRLARQLDERARAEVVDERQVVPARDGGELAHLRLLREADLAEVGLVDAEQQRGLGADRRLEVGRARPVRRADLAQARARAGEHVGDAKAVADLDQLAARHEHLASLGQRGQREQHRRGVVVDDERALGAGQPAQQRRHVRLPRPARAVDEVVLEIGVAPCDVDHPVDRGLRQRRATEVRVDDHAGRVQHAAQLRTPRGRELAQRPLDEVARIGARPDLLARPLERRPRRLDRVRVRLARQPLVAQELVHRREVAQPHGNPV